MTMLSCVVSFPSCLNALPYDVLDLKNKLFGIL